MEQRLNAQENKAFNGTPRPKMIKRNCQKFHSLYALKPRLIRKGTCVGKTKEESKFSLSSSSCIRLSANIFYLHEYFMYPKFLSNICLSNLALLAILCKILPTI